MFRERLPMNLQLFAEDTGASTGGGSGTESSSTASQNPPATNQTPVIDYGKIQQMLNGTLAANEEAALKSYFKQQGLSQEDAEKAMATFKAEKAKNQPDIGVLQSQIAQAQAVYQKSQIDNAAILQAMQLGLDAKTIPYVLKMADLSQVMEQEGKINQETLKNALNKVLDDIPALKPQATTNTGFVQVGAAGGTQVQSSTDAELDRIFGVKKK